MADTVENDDPIRRLRQQPILWVGPLQLTLDSKAAAAAGVALPLTKREYAVLELLVLRKGAVLSKTALIAHVDGKSAPAKTKAVDILICKLRKKLACAGLPNLIGTAWGRGYVLHDPGHDGYGTAFSTDERFR